MNIKDSICSVSQGEIVLGMVVLITVAFIAGNLAGIVSEHLKSRKAQQAEADDEQNK